MTILTENCLITIYKSLRINRVGLSISLVLVLGYSSSWRSKSSCHWSRSSCSHRRSKWRWLKVLNLIRWILDSHWWRCKLLLLFHNRWTLWNFCCHWIMHRWSLDCLNWRLIYYIIYSLSLRLYLNRRWPTNWLFYWRRSDNLMHRLLYYLILRRHLLLCLRNWFLCLNIGRIKYR